MYISMYKFCLILCIRSISDMYIFFLNYLLFHLFIHSFIHSFVRSFVCSFIHSFVQSFIHSFVHSFIHSLRAQGSNITLWSLPFCCSWHDIGPFKPAWYILVIYLSHLGKTVALQPKLQMKHIILAMMVNLCWLP